MATDLMPRETTEIKTPAGNVLVVIKSLNGYESRALQVPYLKLPNELDEARVRELGERAARFEAAQNLAFKTVVVSLNGKKDGEDGLSMSDAILSLPSAEYKFIVSAINSVVADEDFNEKKNQS